MSDLAKATVRTWNGSEWVLTEDADDIPDSGGNHQWNFDEGSGTIAADSIGSLHLDFTSISSWGSGVGAGDAYAILDGSTDQATVDNSSFAPLRENAEGTFIFWIRNDVDGGFIQTVSATEFAGSNTNYVLTVRFDEDEYVWRLALDGDDGGGEVTGGTPSNNVGDWVALAAVAGDDSNNKLYIAEPDGYDVTELGSGPTPSPTTNNWEHEPGFGFETAENDRHFEGGYDISIYDPEPYTQSEVQQWVDETKRFFE